MSFDVDVESTQEMDANIRSNAEMKTNFSPYIIVHDTDYYTGSYTYTPDETTQIVQISGLLAAQDITINPIPSDYGHIAWDGSVLTVS